MDARVAELIAASNYGHVSTLMPDGSPHVAPVWIGLEDDRLCFVKQVGSLGLRNLETDPRVAVSVQDHANPYRSALLRGAVATITPGEEAWAWNEAACLRYTGGPYPGPAWDAALVQIEVHRTLFQSFDAFEHRPSR